MRRAFALIGVVVGLLMVGESAWGQAWPTDWSNRHYLYQHGVEASKAERINIRNDTRRYADLMRRTRGHYSPRPVSTKSVGHVDWNASLGGGTLAEGAFPAKYSYDPSVAESCSGDWVVYGTNTAGSAKVPNVIAYKNLYPSPTCTGTVPTLKFAYYVAGPITTSPVISLDGTKIAFVEGAYNGAHAKFHVVSTAGAGILGQAITPPGNVSIDLGSSDTLSSPFVDYANDFAYVGTDDGNLHKLTGVFEGTPTAAGTPWPVQLSANLNNTFGAYAQLSSPVVYNPSGSGLGVVLVAGNYLINKNPSGYETLFSVNANTGATSISGIAVGGFSVSDAPLVDLTNNMAYLFSGNSNSTYQGTGPAAVEQVGLKYSGTTFSFGTVTQAVMGGVPTAGVTIAGGAYTSNPVHSGSFDNNWYTSANGTGYLVACGTSAGNAAPTVYSFKVSAGVLTTKTSGATPISTSATDLCSPLTEAYDGTNDRFFVGTQKNGVASTVCKTTGCIQDFALSSGVPQPPTVGQTEASGTSGIVVDAGTGTSTYIYFTTLNASGNGVTGNPAIQLSQQTLN